MKKYLIYSFTIISPLIFLTTFVSARGADFETNTGLQEIQLPLFYSTSLDFVQNASVISWLAFAGSIFTIAILAFWVFRILVAGIAALRSEGDATKLQDSYSKIKSNFTGMFITFLIPLILSLVGSFFGIGTILQWPKSFQLCSESSIHRFYFEAFLKNGTEESAKAACGI